MEKGKVLVPRLLCRSILGASLVLKESPVNWRKHLVN